MTVPAPVAFENGPIAVTGDNLNSFVIGGMLRADAQNFIGVPKQTLELLGLATINDGQGGVFYWNASGTANDGTNNIQPFGVASGCWTRATVSSGSGGACGALGIINVQCPPYNAVGDGTTNDTAAIQRALNVGTEVWFPPGTYLTDTLTVGSNTMLSGAGKGATALVSLAGNPILTNINSTTGNVEIRDMWLYGQHGIANGTSTGVGIQFTGAGASRPSVLRFTNLGMQGFATAINNYLCANTYYTDLFITRCSSGIISNTCADTNLSNVEVQNDPAKLDNTGYGFTFSNDLAHGADDEGVRASGLSTNGQFGGLLVQNQNFGICTNFSFSTTLANAMVFEGVSQWTVSGGESSPASAFAALVTTIGSASQVTTQCVFTGIRFSNATFGAVLAGTYLTMGNCNFTANSNTDIDLGATAHGCGVSGCACLSVGVGTSIVETSGADYNQITGNRVIGSVSILGAHSSATNNLVVT